MKTENCKLYYLAFSHFLGIGPMKFKALIMHLGGVSRAYLAGQKDIGEVIGLNLAEKFVSFRNEFDPVKKLEELKRKEITVLAVDNEDYPENLKNISDPPICLYIRGSIPKFFDAVGAPTPQSAKNLVSSPISFAIVGTRKPTPYGQQVASKFAFELASAGFVIVSGLATGIDTVAHRSCLEAGGKTIAVLGCGVDVIYPAINQNLYHKIIDSGGAVISEFPPGQFVLKGLFISRNRLISGLSRGVMIVEGTEDSGSLITAKHAAEQGKDVFAPPSPITSNMSAAPNLLLKQGAKLVTKVEDIYEEFDMKITPKKKEDILEELDKDEKEIFLLLNEKPQLIDDLAINLKKPVSEILNIISVMEIAGIVEKNIEHKYQVRL